MFIKCYGLFWRRDEVDWTRGTGKTFRLLVRYGTNRPGIRIVDIREQTGIYILYGNHGACYVGLTNTSMGKRLKDHLWDHLCNEWDRFSWFGFRKMLVRTDENGLCEMGEMANTSIGSPTEVITDVEALLIRAMGLMNIRKMNFTNAEEWTQIKNHEIDHHLAKL